MLPQENCVEIPLSGKVQLQGKQCEDAEVVFSVAQKWHSESQKNARRLRNRISAQ